MNGQRFQVEPDGENTEIRAQQGLRIEQNVGFDDLARKLAGGRIRDRVENRQ